MNEKNLGTTLTILPLGILILSCLKLFIYYSYYNVPISDYLGFSEVGFIIIGEILLITGFVISFLYLNTWIAKTDLVNSFFPKWNKYILILISLFLMGYLIYSFVQMTRHPKSEDYLLHVEYSIKLYFSSYLLYIVNYNTLAKGDTRHYSLMNSILLVVFVLYLQSNLALSDIKEVNNGKYFGTEIVTKDSTYTSTPKSYYIGKTEKFAFVYNKKDSSSLSIPMPEIVMIKHKYKAPK